MYPPGNAVCGSQTSGIWLCMRKHLSSSCWLYLKCHCGTAFPMGHPSHKPPRFTKRPAACRWMGSAESVSPCCKCPGGRGLAPWLLHFQILPACFRRFHPPFLPKVCKAGSPGWGLHWRVNRQKVTCEPHFTHVFLPLNSPTPTTSMAKPSWKRLDPYNSRIIQ